MSEVAAKQQIPREPARGRASPPHPDAHRPGDLSDALTRWRAHLSLVWVIARREMNDTLRDWRLVVPILLLTLVFPVILNIAAGFTLNFVRQYNADVVGEQAIPFMLLVVGFFPLSFSLVLALEAFVGEKERKSLEPLLATPLSNTQLYLGKALSALIPPVLAAYLGISVYLLSLFLNIDYQPPTVLVLQVLLLTAAESMVMVSAAVIISSQTTSVRAANLLASFIIIPMAFLVQAEAVMMFWRRYDMLWFILLALLVCDIILVRMGIRIFNREELLGRQIDSLNPGRSLLLFMQYLVESPSGAGSATYNHQESKWRSLPSRLARFYRIDLPPLLRLNRAPAAAVLFALAAALIVGGIFAVFYPLPTGIFELEGIDSETFNEFEGTGLIPSLSTWGILSHNVRSLLIATALAVPTFGSLAIVMLMAPIAIIGYVTAQVAIVGQNPLLFFGVFVLPHGLVELPAALLATAAALRLGMSIIAPPPGLTVSQSWLQALAHFLKLFLLVVIPLLAVAAFIEANITPQLAVAVFGN